MNIGYRKQKLLDVQHILSARIQLRSFRFEAIKCLSCETKENLQAFVGWENNIACIFSTNREW